MTATAEQIKSLGDDLKSTWEHTKTVLDTQAEEVKRLGEATGETKQAFDRLNGRLDSTEETLADLQAKMTRPGGVDNGNPVDPDETRAAFHEFLRKGVEPDALKALSRGSDSAGGVFVPEGVATELIKNLVEVSDIRKLADSVTLTDGDSYPFNKRTGEAAGGWTSEQGTRAETTNPAFAKGRIPVHEQYLMIDMHRQLLDMSGFDVEGEWQGEAVEQGAKLEGAAFVSGDGNGKPEGYTHANAGLSNTVSGHATLLQADTLIGLPLDMKAGYLQNAKFALNRSTLKAVRQLKNGNGDYLWTAGFGTTLAQGMPATIDGYGYEIAQDMPDIGAGTFPIAFGDFKQGYKIVDHTKMHQIRDEVTQAATGFVRFWVTRYVGGQVVKAEALRLYKISAS